jgi:GMP synthase-like glutamine amidotransferase
MKTLLIDNGTTLLAQLQALLPGDELVATYDRIPVDAHEYDVVILSGSSRFPIHGNEAALAAEIDFIRTVTIPVIGICFGHELIVHAFGGEIEYLGGSQKGMVEIAVTAPHPMFGDRTMFTVYENHQYGARALPSSLEPLAQAHDVVAVLKHKERPIYGFQFHPEHHTDTQYGDEVFLRLLKTVTS